MSKDAKLSTPLSPTPSLVRTLLKDYYKTSKPLPINAESSDDDVQTKTQIQKTPLQKQLSITSSGSADPESKALQDLLREELLKRSSRYSRSSKRYKRAMFSAENLTWNGASQAVLLSKIGQGDGLQQRTGDSVKIHRIRIRITYNQPANLTGISGPTYQGVNISETCFVDRISAVPGAMPTVYSSNQGISPVTNVAALYISPQNPPVHLKEYLPNPLTLGHNGPPMFHVYRHEVHDIESPLQVFFNGAGAEFVNKGWIRTHEFEINCHGRRVEFTGTGDSTPAVNAIWLHLQASPTSSFWGYAQIYLTYTWIVDFEDVVD